MDDAAVQFWTWFCDFASQLPPAGVSELALDDLLHELHKFDDRLFFLMSTSTSPRELIITVDGNKEAFGRADALVDAAPKLDGWKFISLKPAMGFAFRHTDGPIALDVSQLWFMPLVSRASPSQLGIRIGFPDADFVLANQSVDTAYTILE